MEIFALTLILVYIAIFALLEVNNILGIPRKNKKHTNKEERTI